MLSVAVKLKVTLVVEKLESLAGVTRVTAGAVPSTRKMRVPLVPFWRLSLAVTDQLWRPSARVKVVMC